jgi:predicted molibdopterin-dependent oxidoreductase YjgC
VISKNAIRKKTGGLKEYQQSISNLKLEDVLTETGISEGQFSKLSQWLGNPAENVVFIHNEDSNLSRDTGALSAIANYLLLTNRVSKAGNGLILLHDHVNSAGLFDMGADHRYLPGRIRSGAGENELPAKLRSGKIKAAVIFGEDPFSDVELQKQMESFELVIACDTHLTATVAKADVVIPANTIIEQSGTYTRHDNVIQKSAKVVNGVNSISNWQVIQKLIQCFIPDMSISTLDDIHTLITNESNGRISFSEGTSWTETYFRNGFTSQKVELTPYSTETVAGSQALPAVTYADRYFRTAIQARIAK